MSPGCSPSCYVPLLLTSRWRSTCEALDRGDSCRPSKRSWNEPRTRRWVRAVLSILSRCCSQSAELSWIVVREARHDCPCAALRERTVGSTVAPGVSRVRASWDAPRDRREVAACTVKARACHPSADSGIIRFGIVDLAAVAINATRPASRSASSSARYGTPRVPRAFLLQVVDLMRRISSHAITWLKVVYFRFPP